MSNEELAMRIKAGEQEHLVTLWGQIKRLVAVIAYRYNGLQERYSFIDFEDLTQCGYFAMLKAIKSFNPEKGFKFTSYLNFHYRNCIYDMIGSRKSRTELIPPAISLNATLNSDSDTEFMTMVNEAASGDVSDNLEQEELSRIVAAAVDKLHGKQPAIIKGLYFEDKTLAQLAEELNIYNAERVRQIKIRAFERLRAMPELRELYFTYYGYHELTPPDCTNSSPEQATIYNENWESWRANLEKEMERLKNGL